MSRNGRVRLFGAFIEPQGIHAVEYAREANGISVLRHLADESRVSGMADGGERLATLIGAGDGSRTSVSAAIRGFGSGYQIMMLPHAAPDILRPIVRRELARLYPDIDNPRVDFVLGGEIDRRRRERADAGAAPLELLAAAVPERAVQAFAEELAARDMDLDHLTVLPQVLQRLYQRSESGFEPTAVLLYLPGGPILGFFHERQLRLTVEPPFGIDMDEAAEVQTILEQVERGALYLRQQFRGAEVNRLLVSAHPDDQERIVGLLQSQLEIAVAPLAPGAGSPAALAALGAVLDADAPSSLNLSPTAVLPEEVAAQTTRRRVLIAAVALASLALIWALFNVVDALRWSSKVDALATQARARSGALTSMRGVVDERQKNAQAYTFLESLVADRTRLQRNLRAVARTTPPGVRLEELDLTRAGEEWQGGVGGMATGSSGADVLLAVDRFFRYLPREMPLRNLLLTQLEDVEPSDKQRLPGMRFRFTFTAIPNAQP